MPNADPKHPSGMILALALIVMLLISMMGVALIANSRTELQITSNTASGREAFARADTLVYLSILISRVMVNPVLGSVDQMISANPEISVAYDEDRFRTSTMRRESAVANNFRRRYIRAGSAGDRSQLDDGYHLQPHLVFKQKYVDRSGVTREVVVGSASVGLEEVPTGNLDPNAPPVVNLIITVNGRPLGDSRMTASQLAAWENAFDGGASDEAYSIITSIYREVAN